jgi:hypothetical protein
MSDADKAVPEATKDALSVLKASKGHQTQRERRVTKPKLATFSWDEKDTQK